MPLPFDISTIDPKLQLLDFDRFDAEESLYVFYKQAWRYIDPSPWRDSWAIDAMCEHLQAVVDGQIRRLILNCPPRLGKQLADDTPVLTIGGWKTHGDLQIGDYVFHPSGVPTKIVAVSGKSPSDVKVEFFDGSVFWCHENHEWALHNRVGGHLEILDTGHFLRSRKGRWGRTSGSIKQVCAADGNDKQRAGHLLPKVWPLQWPQQTLPIHPYVLGAWLGDGSSTKPCLTHALSDTQHIDKIVSCGYRISVKYAHKTTGVITTSFSKTNLTRDLRNAKVFCNKHIPDIFLRSSISQRLELLAGLMDTDGTVDKHSRCHFSNTNERLIEGVIDLVSSFGWRTSVCKQEPATSSSGIKATKPCYSVSFQPDLNIPTALVRKRILRFPDFRRIGLKYVSRDPCGKVGHCIQVEAADGMYLVGKRLTPTHNSNLTAVTFPAWTWAQRRISPTSGAGVAFLHASYSNQLSLRDSVKCRRLIESSWYQKLWSDRFALTSDQNTKSRFSNDRGGERLITSVGAGVTGEGFSVGIIDDANSAGEAFSEAAIHEVTAWWDQVMPTRMNDPSTGAIVIIQQRLAEDDLTGHILEKNSGDWCHLMLPMRYEPDRSYITTIGWKDPRTVPGELLWPERFNEESVNSLEIALGPMISNGQLQQRPEPAGGGIIRRDYWQLWDKDTFPAMDFILASLDTAYTTKSANDYSALTIWGVFSPSAKAQANRMIDSKGNSVPMYRSFDPVAPRVMLAYAWRDRLELHHLVEKVAGLCKSMKVDLLLIENKAAGISVGQEIRRLYGNEQFGVQFFDPKSQDKLSRLYSVQHLFAEGIIYAPDRKWSDMVISEVAQFPYGKFDDLTDTVSQALRHLRDNGLLARAVEKAAEFEEMKAYRGREQPLYGGV